MCLKLSTQTQALCGALPVLPPTCTHSCCPEPCVSS